MAIKCKRTGRLRKRTKSGRKCRKKKNCKNGNLKTHIKRRQCKKRKSRRKSKKNCKKGLLKKPTKSGRICRKKTKRSIKLPPSNCVGLKRDTCKADPNCIYKKGKNNKHHCAATSKGYGAYSGPVTLNKSKPKPSSKSAVVLATNINTNDPVKPNEWACTNPYDASNYTKEEYNNSCSKGGIPKQGYENLPKNKEDCMRLCTK